MPRSRSWSLESRTRSTSVLVGSEHARRAQHGVDERRLAMVDVRDERDGTERFVHSSSGWRGKAVSGDGSERSEAVLVAVGFLFADQAPTGVIRAGDRTALHARLGIFGAEERVEVVVGSLERARLFEATMTTLLHGPAPTSMAGCSERHCSQSHTYPHMTPHPYALADGGAWNRPPVVAVGRRRTALPPVVRRFQRRRDRRSGRDPPPSRPPRVARGRRHLAVAVLPVPDGRLRLRRVRLLRRRSAVRQPGRLRRPSRRSPRARAEDRDRLGAEPQLGSPSVVRRVPLVAGQPRSATGTSGAIRPPTAGPPTTGSPPSPRAHRRGPSTRRPGSTTCTSSCRSNPISTGAIPRSSRPCTTRCGSGSTVASTASAWT